MVVSVDDPDVHLMLRVQAGETGAFEKLFAQYKRPIVNFARRYLGNMARAEDAAQETFLRLYRARADYRPETRFRTYLYRIATNTCLNHLRKRDWLTREAPAEPVDTAFATPEQALQGEEMKARVQKALMALPESQRTALLLLRFEDMSYEEIASVMDKTVPAVKALLNRAKEFMVRSLC